MGAGSFPAKKHAIKGCNMAMSTMSTILYHTVFLLIVSVSVSLVLN